MYACVNGDSSTSADLVEFHLEARCRSMSATKKTGTESFFNFLLDELT